MADKEEYESHSDPLTNITPDRSEILGMIVPYQGIDAIDEVRGRGPSNVHQGSGVSRPPMPWGGYEYQDEAKKAADWVVREVLVPHRWSGEGRPEGIPILR